jgi:hypothetical protein
MEVPVSLLLYLFGFNYCEEVRGEKAQIRLKKYPVFTPNVEDMPYFCKIRDTR